MFEKFKPFCNLIHNQYNRTIKILRSNNGGEYVNDDMHTYFNAYGIIHQTTCPITPQQNGTTERKNRNLIAITSCAIILESEVPWHEVVATASYLTNRLPIKKVNFQTHIDVFCNYHNHPTKLTISPRVFGFTIYVHIPI